MLCLVCVCPVFLICLSSYVYLNFLSVCPLCLSRLSFLHFCSCLFVYPVCLPCLVYPLLSVMSHNMSVFISCLSLMYICLVSNVCFPERLFVCPSFFYIPHLIYMFVLSVPCLSSLPECLPVWLSVRLSVFPHSSFVTWRISGRVLWLYLRNLRGSSLWNISVADLHHFSSSFCSS